LYAETKAVCKLNGQKTNWQVTAPKKNAGGSISFLPTSCRFAKISYFYVGKKEYSISATNKYCVGRKHFGFKAALLLAPKR
jgi:hypothetical protein